MGHRQASPRRSARQAAAGVALIGGVVLSGCGSDSDDSLTVESFRSQANEICAVSAAEIGEAVGAVFGSGEPSPESMQAALDTIVTVSRRDLDDIEALGAPDSIDAEVDALLAEGRSATDEAEAQGLGFWENDGDPWAKTNELAAALGLDACASG